jgi:hypothetical protein
MDEVPEITVNKRESQDEKDEPDPSRAVESGVSDSQTKDRQIVPVSTTETKL